MTLNRCCRPTICVLVCLGIVMATVSVASASWKEKVLYSFQGGLNDGAGPAGGVVLDKAGNLYGATTGGGPDSCAPIGNACGLVFQLSPPVKQGDHWTETIIFQFKGKGANDASAPSGGVILDSAGNVYGVTAYGGTGDCVNVGVTAGCGTVYELSPPVKHGDPWTETILHSFKSGKDGYFPWGSLTFDAQGNLYGATQFGGGKGTTCNPYYQYCGTVFELSPTKQKGGAWTEKVLHSFGSGKDGANPNGGLVLDSKGAIYGTTRSGGNQGCKTSWSLGCGTVVSLSPPRRKGGPWTEKLLHVFSGGADGAGTVAGLTVGNNGDLYGTAGGGSQQFGIVFRLASPKRGGHWIETVLHNFTGGHDGRGPTSGVVFGEDGSLYGAIFGGTIFGGVVYRLNPVARRRFWALSVVHNFTGNPDGAYPEANMVFDKAGNLYSTTQAGGTGQSCNGGCGAVFDVSP
jgi:hypothetical protein